MIAFSLVCVCLYLRVRACVHAHMRECMRACLCMSDPRFIRFVLGSCYAVRINALSIESVHRKEQHAS